MDVALDALRQSTEKLADSVLPAGTPEIAAVPPAIRRSDIVNSRKRLQGSIVRCTDGKMFIIPTSGGLDMTVNKTAAIRLSVTGDEEDT